jgi:hypothetical protein
MIHQQVVKVVGNAAAELAHGVHALRSGELFLGFVQDPLNLHAFGYVARDLGKSDDLSRLVRDRVDHDRGPEAGAVLAYAPPPPRTFLHGMR